MRADPATEVELRDAIRLFGEAVENGNPAGLMDLFVSDSDVVFMGSGAEEVAVGLDAVRDTVERVLSTDARFSFEWDVFHASTQGDTAWVTTLGHVLVAEAREVTPFPYRMSSVLVRRDGRWRWAHVHGSQPFPVDTQSSRPRDLSPPAVTPPAVFSRGVSPLANAPRTGIAGRNMAGVSAVPSTVEARDRVGCVGGSATPPPEGLARLHRLRDSEAGR